MLDRFTFRLFTFQKIPCIIHWSLVLMFAVLLLSSVAFLDFNTMIVFAIAMLSIIPHEYGHSLMGKRLKVPTRAIYMTPVGGVALMEAKSLPAEHELLITGAGPVVTLVLAMFFSILWAVLAPIPFLGKFVSLVALVNWSLFIFNALPVFPMDGGRIWRAVLYIVMDDYMRATKVAVRSGQCLAGVIGVLGLLVGQVGVVITLAAVMFLSQLELRQVEKLGTRKHV
jgi:stage IV sporulation protein FB